MGRRGPPRTPTAVRALKGTLQPCRTSPDEPEPRPGTPEAPAFLDDDALAEWTRITPQLAVRGLLETIDMAVVAVYCTAWSQLAAAQEALRVEGPVVLDTHGRVVTSPHAKLATTARMQVIAACRELGLSPSARATVKAGSPPVEPEREAAIRRFFGGVRGGR